MTVRDFIEILNNLSEEEKDLPIWDWGYEPIEGIEYREEVPIGDTANPNCKYISVMMIM